MTDKLYYQNSHLFEHSARVLSCRPDGKGTWALELDCTAFFPEGGGQRSDTGFIDDVPVIHVAEKNGLILHTAASPLPVGARVQCRVDREQRLRRMQNHSGEHVVSGLVHQLFGFENVGFHMGDEFMTVDFSGELEGEDILRLETAANETVRSDLPVTAYFPSPEELRDLDYRSKLDLTENVRLVRIPGVDLCACCAPHVDRTGEIGLIRILDFMRHRGGTRITLVCGMDALDDCRRRQANIRRISEALSAKQEDIADYVDHLLETDARRKQRIADISLAFVSLMASRQEPVTGNICLFDSLLDEIALRELVNLLVPRCTGLAAVFFPAGDGRWRYIMGSAAVDLRRNAPLINRGIGGKGGGSASMIQGSCTASEEEIRSFICQFST